MGRRADARVGVCACALGACHCVVPGVKGEGVEEEVDGVEGVERLGVGEGEAGG